MNMSTKGLPLTLPTAARRRRKSMEEATAAVLRYPQGTRVRIAVEVSSDHHLF